MAISYLSMSEKTDLTTRMQASEYNEIKDALTDGTKSIATQGIKVVETAYASSGALNVGGFANMDSSGGALIMTLANPGATGILQILTLGTAGNNATITTATAGGFNGIDNTAVFNAAAETLILISISTTRWVIIQNVGGVALSTV